MLIYANGISTFSTMSPLTMLHDKTAMFCICDRLLYLSVFTLIHKVATESFYGPGTQEGTGSRPCLSRPSKANGD